MLTVSQSILAWAKNHSVLHVFLIPGSQIGPFSNAVVCDADIRPIVACHELGAGFMADGYAQVRRGIAIAASSGGPGALYMLPTAVNARIERSPVLFITGDVPRWLEKEYPFQNTQNAGSRDQTLFLNGSGMSVRLQNSNQLDECLNACDTALSAMQPAHLVLPFDVQDEEYEPSVPLVNNQQTQQHNISAIQKLVSQWNGAKSPLLLLGHRLTNTTDPHLIRQLIEQCGVPVATTYGAKGLIEDDYPLSLGNFGYGGTENSYNALANCEHDLVLIIGADLGQREIFDWENHFNDENRVLVRLDIKTPQDQSGYPPDEEIHVESFTDALNIFIQLIEPQDVLSPTVSPVVNYADTLSQDEDLDEYINICRTVLPSNTVLFVDAGRHRLCAGRSWKILEPGTFYSSPDQAPMGWGIAAAIGGKLARPGSLFLVLTGDGCMRMHGQEVAVAARYKIPIIILVANNSGYGSISARAPNAETLTELGNLPEIDWVEYTRALGGDGCRVRQSGELEQTLIDAMQKTGPYVIDILLSPVKPQAAGFADLWPCKRM